MVSWISNLLLSSERSLPSFLPVPVVLSYPDFPPKSAGDPHTIGFTSNGQDFRHWKEEYARQDKRSPQQALPVGLGEGKKTRLLTAEGDAWVCCVKSHRCPRKRPSGGGVSKGAAEASYGPLPRS
ncbi:hypothetical protein Taro_002133 [Colocasia esculenta]|uniref:Uncharacterized protein n=1 Tax=Colocasia esculenta TaxID=4460 RepID=A0A843TI55_COLES|nr:hypothetical protein [Colocasia esculenta]